MVDSFEHDTPRDYAFDEFANLAPEPLQTVLEWLGQVCDAGRKRQLPVEIREHRDRIIGLVVANALAANAHPRGPSVHYSRARGTYTGQGPYHPDWLSYRLLIGVVDALTDEGLLGGVRSRPTGMGDLPQSTLKARPPLLEGLEARGVGQDAVIEDREAAPVLVLKGPPQGNRKPRQRYARDNPDIAALIEPVRSYNTYIAGQELDWQPPQEVRDGIAQRRDDNGQPYLEPDVNERRLRRVFNNGQFNLGGRFFGGWWQNIPSDTRQFIIINNEPTVELDYSGFLPRAIYHEEHLELEGDAYEIPFIRDRAEHQGMDWERVVRPSLKKMLNIILNSTSPAGRQRIQGITLPRGVTKTRAYQLLEQKHDPISASFYQGRGLELMNRESEVCQTILTAGIEAGVPVLPVHDSFVVPASQEEWLRQRMDQSYFDEFGSHPVIH